MNKFICRIEEPSCLTQKSLQLFHCKDYISCIQKIQECLAGKEVLDDDSDDGSFYEMADLELENHGLGKVVDTIIIILLSLGVPCGQIALLGLPSGLKPSQICCLLSLLSPLPIATYIFEDFYPLSALA